MTHEPYAIQPVYPPLNEPLIAEILDRIEENPASWNQASWGIRPSAEPCGTTFCFAGHVAASAAQAHPTEVQLNWGPWISSQDSLTLVVVNGEPTSVKVFAEKRLGLTSAEAARLFYSTPTSLSAVRDFFTEARATRAFYNSRLTRDELDLAGGPQ